MHPAPFMICAPLLQSIHTCIFSVHVGCISPKLTMSMLKLSRRTSKMANPFRYTTAIVRGMAESLPASALRMSPSDEPVCYSKALQQKSIYTDILREIGLKVVELPADESQPDCVFVEDTVVVIGRTALITNPGHSTRQQETKPMEQCLRDLGLNVIVMKDKDPEAKMDGGDVLFTGEEVFVGISNRTNTAGCQVLADVFSSYPVSPVKVGGSLHLKSGCSLGKPGVIIQATSSQDLLDMANNLRSVAKKKYVFASVEGNSIASNCVYIDSPKFGPTVIHPPFTKFPNAEKVYQQLKDVKTFECGMSELNKVDGALTCCSVLLSEVQQ